MRRTVATGGNRCPSLKRRYKDHESAVRALRNLSAKGPRRGKTLARAYPCDMCHGWHLTSRAQ